MTTRPLRLGLIGDNIDSSQSPRLHKACGALTGIPTSYTRLVPPALGLDFDTLFDSLPDQGYHGVNVTYPYKERAAARVTIADPATRAIGAVNTVLFTDTGPQGFNTDHSGFLAAYRATRGTTPPGTVCLIGAGGVGKAVGFALLTLGASELICVDLDPLKARHLADALAATGTRTRITVSNDAIHAAQRAQGIVNCSPVGMVNIGGTPLPPEALSHAAWAFDAVYTPTDTRFLQDARRLGLTTITGYDLFFAQGLDAWALFSGHPVDPDALRATLQDTAA